MDGMTQNELTHVLIGMVGAWGGIGIWQGIRALQDWGAHKWACSCSCFGFKVEASDALFLERIKASHLDRTHDVREPEEGR
jgi:hypothetical protein